MNKRIMIVDDDRALLEELEESLILNDYDVVAVSDSRRVMEEFNRRIPDLILLDLKMPEESGFQVACKCKYFSQLKGIPIIAMSAHYQESYALALKNYGIQDYVKKPFDVIDVILKIERAL
jgi:DNA-binding response OmpR family regulator